jgi:ribonuclease E
MANKMLIDAAHPEETRVVVLRGNRVQEFDFESASRKQLRGNIYLAKVTRVEPSLQAAFVDYGGNRHGFLAFSEIHPDYYQIPIADRQALIEAERREIAEAERRSSEAERGAESEAEGSAGAAAEGAGADFVEAESAAAEAAEPPHVSEPARFVEAEMQTEPAWDAGAASPSGTAAADGEPERLAGEGDDGGGSTAFEREGETAVEGQGEAEPEPLTGAVETVGEDGERDSEGSGETVEVISDDQVESVGAEDALEEVPERRRALRPRQYKIQEVIKRRQVLLVQVVKEERGNKGAALTTYLSLAGRYSVLMPNTARGGGISRKITSPADRKRMKDVVAELDVPEGMGVILRTAGASRTKAEVKRDFEYLLRLWENVRELTLRSTAPTLVYEEGSLIKRSIRDLYNKDIDEIIVAGEEAYREAKDFMRMLMPSHAKNVKPYRESQPLFARAGIEAQLDAMFSPQVTLRSGGYLIINQTEALVSIDVNSGRATREHNIEDTALQTNLEAAEEIARQLRLRDLAGLIVIDFIDMEEKRNNRAVERRLKEALKNDRARIQVGRISHFGLLEMSRQRIRTGVLESTTTVCPTCQGTGHVRAPSSVALHVLRSIEEQLLKSASHNLTIRTRTPVALYVLNQKRANLSDLEQRFGVTIAVLADEALASGTHFTVERGEPAGRREPVRTSVQPDSVQPIAEEAEQPAELGATESEAVDEESDAAAADALEREGDDDGEGRRRRRRRRGRRSPGERPEGEAVAREGAPVEAEEEAEAAEVHAEDEREEFAAAGEAAGRDDSAGRRRRRGRRGGRRGRRGRDEDRNLTAGRHDEAAAAALAPPGNGAASDAVGTQTETNGEDRDSRLGGTVAISTVSEAGGEDGTFDFAAGPLEAPVEGEATMVHEPAALAPARPDRSERQPEERIVRSQEEEEEEPLPPPPRTAPEAEEVNRPKRSGWWQRKSFF